MGRKNRSRKRDIFSSKRSKKLRLKRLNETEEERRKRREARRIRRARRRFLESPEQLEVQLAISTAGKSRIRDSRRFEARKRRLAVLLADTSNRNKNNNKTNYTTIKVTPKMKTMARLIIKNQLLKRLLRKLQQLHAKKIARDTQGPEQNNTNMVNIEVDMSPQTKTGLIIDIMMLQRCLKKLKQAQEKDLARDGLGPKGKNNKGVKMEVTPKIKCKTEPIINVEMLKRCLQTIQQTQANKIVQIAPAPEKKKKLRVEVTPKIKTNNAPVIHADVLKSILKRIRQAQAKKLSRGQAPGEEQKIINEIKMEIGIPPIIKPKPGPVSIEMLRECLLKIKQAQAKELSPVPPGPEEKTTNDKIEVDVLPNVNPDKDPDLEPKEG